MKDKVEPKVVDDDEEDSATGEDEEPAEKHVKAVPESTPAKAVAADDDED